MGTALARVIRAHLAVQAEQLTQEQISTRVGLSQSQVSLLLLGRRDFTLTAIAQFARLIGIKPHELLEQAEKLNADMPLDKVIDLNRRRGEGGDDDGNDT